MTDYYSSIILISIAALLVMECCVIFNDMLPVMIKHLFALLYGLIIVAAFCEWTGHFLDQASSMPRGLHIAVKVIELSVVPFISLTLCKVFYKGWFLKLAAIVCVLHMILVIVSGFTGLIFYVDSDNVYHHGDFYFIYVVVYILSGVMTLVMAMKYAIKNQYRGNIFITAIFVFLVGAMVYAAFMKGVYVDFLIMAFAGIMIYVFNSDVMLQTDELTKLINRRGYENYLDHIQTRSVIIYLDIDNFKNVNDEYGHSFGDICLMRVADIMRMSFRRVGKCFRIGGDEFCVIMYKDTDRVEEYLEAFEKNMAKVRRDKKLLPMVSNGYVVYNPDTDVIVDAINEVDAKMYENKRRRKAAAAGLPVDEETA